MHIQPFFSSLANAFNGRLILSVALPISTACSVSAFLLKIWHAQSDIPDPILPIAEFFVDRVTVVTLPALGGLMGGIGLARLTHPLIAIPLGLVYAMWLIRIFAIFAKGEDIEDATAINIVLLGNTVNLVASGILFYQAPSIPRALQLGANLPLPLQLILQYTT